MTPETLLAAASTYTADMALVPPEKALRPDLAGMRMYDAPIMGFCDADNAYLAGLPDSPDARVPLKQPREWLSSAKTVISFFMPFTQQVKDSNRQKKDYPSLEWMHARIEGQAFIGSLCGHLVRTLEASGFHSVSPLLENSFWSNTAVPNANSPTAELFTSNWSERHVAYACGLGTFSLSRGIITEKGVAGRLGSVITEMEIPATDSPYSGLTDYCTMCGACADNCPVNAISLEGGKDHLPCGYFLKQTMVENPPYYGCGKCQVNVPCQDKIPGR